MLEVLNAVEVENSKFSEHEVRIEEDKKAAEERKAKGSLNVSEAAYKTAHDDEELWQKDAAKFKPAPRTTNEETDLKSPNRHLDRHLHLIVKRILGQATFWDLPTVANIEGESLRESADRAVTDFCGPNVKVKVLGNAPFAHYKYKYPKKVQEETGKRGEKVFIFKAILDNTACDLDLNKDLSSDYEWALREKLVEKLEPLTQKALLQILYDEDPWMHRHMILWCVFKAQLSNACFYCIAGYSVLKQQKPRCYLLNASSPAWL